MQPSLAAARGLSRCSSWALEHRLSGYGTQGYLLQGNWDLPGSGVKPVSTAWAGRFSTTEFTKEVPCDIFFNRAQLCVRVCVCVCVCTCPG